MAGQIKITIAQINPIVGDIEYNCKLMIEAHRQAKTYDADLIVFPELSITGYPPQDLILKPIFQEIAFREIQKLAKLSLNAPAMLVGFPYKKSEKLYNAVGLLENGKLTAIRLKSQLPNHGVFDEKRIFSSAVLQDVICFKGIKIAVPICEDIWHQKVVQHLTNQGADIFISLNCSPYTKDKIVLRHKLVSQRAIEAKCPFVYVNQIGGQDDLVFDGASFVTNSTGEIVAQLPAFEPFNEVITLCQNSVGEWQTEQTKMHKIELGLCGVYQACVVGLRDYVQKNNFPSIILGLSGGVDSAICAAIAVDAIGADKVHTVMLPYEYTSDKSFEDAKNCADILGIKYEVLPIEKPVNGFMSLLAPMFKGMPSNTTEENIQARTRAIILTAISNKFGSMLITTGNKSEISMGYATLYGDMCGWFNPIKDIYKTDIFALCRMRNAYRPSGCLGKKGVVVPENVINKAPTAELRPNQFDQDTLPPYDVLDDILYSLVELELSQAEAVRRGVQNGFNHSPELVQKTVQMLYQAEYKRRQSAPGVRVSEMGFTTDRRYPITNGFREKHYQSIEKIM